MMLVMKKAMAKNNTLNRKEITHTRIVETAARAIRRSGYDGTGVADIMKEAGLTHGGFYAHFASRDAMLAEAADLAGAETIALAASIFAAAPQDQALQALMKTYLSNEHMANIEKGCVFAALCSEMPRQSLEVRKASTIRIKEMVGLIESRLPVHDQLTQGKLNQGKLNQGRLKQAQASAREEALVTMATLIGSLLLARAVDDTELSTAFRQAVLKQYALESD
jgi:TetR/AcrR family transcriptional regulator, transcriptional repressor for nem operon